MRQEQRWDWDLLWRVQWAQFKVRFIGGPFLGPPMTWRFDNNTPRKFNTTSQNRQVQKQPSFFRGYVKFRNTRQKTTSWWLNHPNRFIWAKIETTTEKRTWNPKWRFGRWFSFSIRWFSGSMLVFWGISANNKQLSNVQNPPLTFHYIEWFLGILIIANYNSYITG